MTGLVFTNNVFRRGAAWYGPGINIIAKSEQPVIADVTIVNKIPSREPAGRVSTRSTSPGSRARSS